MTHILYQCDINHIYILGTRSSLSLSTMYSFNFLAASLSRLYTKAKDHAKVAREHFHGLSVLRGRERVTQWWNKKTQPLYKNNEWHSVYRLKDKKGESK